MGFLRPFEANGLIESPPDSRVQHLFEIGCGDYERTAIEIVHDLQKRVEHPLNLAVLGGIVARPPNGIEFIKKQHPLAPPRVFENLAQVCGGLSQERRHDSVEANVQHGTCAFRRHGGSHGGLAATRWTTENYATDRDQAICFQDVPFAKLTQYAVHRTANRRLQNEVVHVSLGLAYQIGRASC